jgi:hypothetical protein
METTTVSNVYKVLGGVTMAHFIGVIGSAAGTFAGYLYPIPRLNEPDGIPVNAFYGQCVGAALAHTGSVYMGHKISKKADMKYMGKAQMVYSGLGVGLAALTLTLGRFIFEETPQLAGFKVIAPAILIGKSPVKRVAAANSNDLLMRPKTEEERAMTHLARYGTTNLPPRGTGLVRGSLN